MVEELYVILNGQRHRLDLNTPSGISLNFKSNIFGDLSKITCSYSYTFKLPMTANNRRVLENAEDIRHASPTLRKRLQAEFVQNGIPLFSNANLYIDMIDSAYNAVLTWGRVDGLQTLKDNDCSIRKLPLYAEPVYGPASDKMSEWKNTLDFAKPRYNAGLPYVIKEGWTNRYNTWAFFPTPVVPVFRLVELINDTFGTAFNFGSAYSHGDVSNNPQIISYGVLPCIKAEMTAEQSELLKASLHITEALSGTLYATPNVLSGGATHSAPGDAMLYDLVKNSSGKAIGIKVKGNSLVNFDVDGYVRLRLTHEPNEYRNQGRVVYTSNYGTPKLSFYTTENGVSASSVASVEGLYSIGEGVWTFDFAQERGAERLSFQVPPNGIVFCAIEIEANNLQIDSSFTQSQAFVFYPKMTPECIRWGESEDRAGSYKMDLRSNLPDISCMTLVKSLYYMLGAFPIVSSSNEIIPCYYTDIKKNLDNALIADWSGKVVNGFTTLPSKSSFQVNGFAQRNYFLMKNDSLEATSSSDEADVYADGKGLIPVDNELLEKSKTIVQLPFNAPYIRNNKDPFRDTGNTFKFWFYENHEVKVKEGKPCFGVVVPMVQKTTSSSGEVVPTGEVFQSMEVWNGFANIGADPSYAYLQKIMRNPVIITENMKLNEFDLSSLDYTVPVYLDKYGAYFAIVSIVRDSKGMCKCELLKLPHE